MAGERTYYLISEALNAKLASGASPKSDKRLTLLKDFYEVAYIRPKHCAVRFQFYFESPAICLQK